MTFIALLRAIEYGWKQEQLAENAERISALGQELFDRMATLAEHIGRIGGSLDKAVEAYNQAVRSLESRVLPSARKFKALGAGGRKEIDTLDPIEHAVRQLGQPDLPELATDED
jgi:DNA recombination protein RmuC